MISLKMLPAPEGAPRAAAAYEHGVTVAGCEFLLDGGTVKIIKFSAQAADGAVADALVRFVLDSALREGAEKALLPGESEAVSIEEYLHSNRRCAP